MKLFRLAATLAFASFAASALAAGGHHAVDDAGLAEPGTCEAEGWLSRASGERLRHGGLACRVGPVELGASTDYTRANRVTGAGSGTDWEMQAKWATDLTPTFAIGLAWSAGWAAHQSPRYQGHSAVVLATWKPQDDVAVHLNAGRDFNRGAAHQTRAGASVEWTVQPGWSATVERYLEAETHFLRAGLRWSLAEAWLVDVSRAQHLRGPGVSAWTFGITRVFQR